MAKNSTKKMADDVKAVKPAVAEVKTAPAAKEAKPVVKEAKPAAKETKAANEVKEVKKDAPAKAVKATAEKPAAKAAAEKPAKAAAEKTAKAAKPAAKAKAPKADAVAPKKKPGRKPKPVEVSDICAKLYKKVDKTKAAKIKDLIAADIEIWGWEDGSNKHLFVEVQDGAVRVEPYDYVDCTLRAHISFADAMAVLDGKLTLRDALVAGKLNVYGNLAAAVKLAEII